MYITNIASFFLLRKSKEYFVTAIVFSFLFFSYGNCAQEAAYYTERLQHHHKIGDSYYINSINACYSIKDEGFCQRIISVFEDAQKLEKKNIPFSQIVAQVIWTFENSELSSHFEWWAINQNLAWAQYHYLLMERYAKKLHASQVTK